MVYGKEAASDDDTSFWQRFASPNLITAKEALHEGERLLVAKQSRASSTTRSRRLGEAEQALNLAIKGLPNSAEAWFLLGTVLFEEKKERLCEQALRHAETLNLGDRRRFASTLMRATLLLKRGDLEGALRLYNSIEKWSGTSGSPLYGLSDDDRAVLWGNWAETLMALGRLKEAIPLYHEAIQLDPKNPIYHWGLAVALDRNGNVMTALERARTALSQDPSMAVLRAAGVFFVPPEEVNYYLGIGHMAAGHLEHARQFFEKFIGTCPRSPWLHSAQAHLTTLTMSLNAVGAPRNASGHMSNIQRAIARKKAIQSVRYRLRSYNYKFRRCYQQLLEKNPIQAGEVTLYTKVDGRGRPRAVKIRKSTFFDNTFHGCLKQVVTGTSFGPTGSDDLIPVDYTLLFKP